MFNKIKKVVLFLFLFNAAFFALLPASALAQEKLKLYFFYGDGCPHCAKEEIFLKKLEEKNKNNLEILRYEIWYHPQNARLLKEMAGKLNKSVSHIPVTIIEDELIVGYESDETTGELIKSFIEKKTRNENSAKMPESIKIPLIGEVKIKNLSLPVLTVVIAALDGFNPCAMWVLIFLISLLLGMQNRKRMWTLGSAFILTSALFYFLVLSAWLNLFLFLGFIIIIRILIGAAALLSGGYHLKEWWVNREGVCKVTDGKTQKKIFYKVKDIIIKEKFWLAFFGIIFLAIAVNLVELVCSAGLPAVYAQVLSLANLSAWQYYAYIILYTIIFMLDDMIVFSIAMVTLREKIMTASYSRWSNLIGGIIMLIIGILLIFKPNWLMFG